MTQQEIKTDKTMHDEAMYMNPVTGSADTYRGWYYENTSGETVNAVARGEVVKVIASGDGWEVAE